MNVTINFKSLIQDVEQEVYEIEHHIHRRSIFFGNGATVDSLTPYTLTSGNGDFGSEVLLLDTTDTPVVAGNKFYDPHEVFFVDSSETTSYIIRFVWGNGTIGDAESANQYTTFPFQKIISTGNANGSIEDIGIKRLVCGYHKLWAKCKNVTNLATVTLFFGIHEYCR